MLSSSMAAGAAASSKSMDGRSMLSSFILYIMQNLNLCNNWKQKESQPVFL